MARLYYSPRSELFDPSGGRSGNSGFTVAEIKPDTASKQITKDMTMRSINLLKKKSFIGF